MKRLFGAILAGGLSTRMGADKASLRLNDGRMMIEHVAGALRVVCEDVVVAGGPVETAAGMSCARIEDQRPGAGPLGGIEALLASGIARAYLVCSCDTPFITADVLQLLLRHPDAQATVLRKPGKAHCDPLPARITSDTLPIVQRLLDADERSVWRLMEELRAAIVDVTDHDHVAALRNINTPGDLNTP